MLKKIVRGLSATIVSILLFSNILFAFPSLAKASSADDIRENPIHNVIEASPDNQEIVNNPIDPEKAKPNPSEYPDLGDEQVFPFVAGLDSY